MIDYVDYGEEEPPHEELDFKKAKREWTRYLNKMDAVEFLNYIVNNSTRSLNNVVQGGHFKAYDIATRLLEEGKVTEKQRKAISNVFIYLKVVVDEELPY